MYPCCFLYFGFRMMLLLPLLNLSVSIMTYPYHKHIILSWWGKVHKLCDRYPSELHDAGAYYFLYGISCVGSPYANFKFYRIIKTGPHALLQSNIGWTCLSLDFTKYLQLFDQGESKHASMRKIPFLFHTLQPWFKENDSTCRGIRPDGLWTRKRHPFMPDKWFHTQQPAVLTRCRITVWLSGAAQQHLIAQAPVLTDIA